MSYHAISPTSTCHITRWPRWDMPIGGWTHLIPLACIRNIAIIFNKSRKYTNPLPSRSPPTPSTPSRNGGRTASVSLIGIGHGHLLEEIGWGTSGEKHKTGIPWHSGSFLLRKMVSTWSYRFCWAQTFRKNGVKILKHLKTRQPHAG